MARVVRLRDRYGRFTGTSFGAGAYQAVDFALPDRVERVVSERVTRAAEIIRLRVLDGMKEPHTGREYTVPGTSITYIASSPGEYPAIRLGQLWPSIQIVKASGGLAFVGSDVEYAPYLEYPNKRGTERPFLSKAYMEKFVEIKALMQGNMDESLRRDRQKYL